MRASSNTLAEALYRTVSKEPQRVRVISENFVRYLRQKRRMKNLPAILTHLHSIAATEQQIQEAVVTSAFPITQLVKKRLEQFIRKRTGIQKVNAKYLTDSKLLGGARIRFNDTVIDATVAASLYSLME